MFQLRDDESPDVLRKKFETAREQVAKAAKHYEECMYKYEINSNFRYIDQTPNLRGKAECQLLLAEIIRNLALLQPKGSSERTEGLGEARGMLEQAQKGYAALVGKRARRGLGHCMRTSGRLKEDVADLAGARDEWKKALAYYQENGDSVLEAEAAKDIEDVSIEIDRVAVFKKRLAEMKLVDSKEEQAVRAAFEKFDVDGSGEMDMAEYNALAVELGTFPPLSKAELHEALMQLDNSRDGKISFDEFWTWWVTDMVLADGGKSKK